MLFRTKKDLSGERSFFVVPFGEKKRPSAAAVVVCEQTVGERGERAVLAHAVQEGDDDGQPAAAENIFQTDVFVGEHEREDQDPKAAVSGTTRIAVHYVKPPI